MFETNLARIKELAQQKEKENGDFRTYLKGCDIEPEAVDAIVHRLYAQVSSKIDCRQCANCCRELAAALGREDIERLARAEQVADAAIEELASQPPVASDKPATKLPRPRSRKP